MPAVNCQGVILKRVNFGEADRIITSFTDRFGKISIVARGVRKVPSRRAPNMEVLNQVNLHLFKAKGYSLTEAEAINTFERLKSDLTLATYAFHILELVDRLTAEGQRNMGVYTLLIKTLENLIKNPRQIWIRAFEVKLLSLMGFWSTEALPSLNETTKKFFHILETDSWEEIAKITITKEQAVELERILRYYIEKTLESSLRSVQVLKKLKS